MERIASAFIVGGPRDGGSEQVGSMQGATIVDLDLYQWNYKIPKRAEFMQAKNSVSPNYNAITCSDSAWSFSTGKADLVECSSIARLAVGRGSKTIRSAAIASSLPLDTLLWPSTPSRKSTT